MSTAPPSSRRAFRMMEGAIFARPNYLPVFPALAFLTIFFILPLVVTGYESLHGNVLINSTGLNGQNYAYILSSGYYWNVVWRTLRIAFVATAFAIVIGYPTGLLLRNAGPRLTACAFATMTLAILAGPLVVILGWMALLSDGGPLLGPLTAGAILPPLHLIGTQSAVVISLVQFILPFVVLTLYATFRQIPDSALEAAASLGATRLQILRHVVGPLSLPGLLSALIIAFTLSSGSYVSPHYMGGATQATLATIVSDFVLGTYNMPMAATVSTLLIVVTAIVTAALTQFLSHLVRS